MPHLFTPYTLKGVTLRNRIAMSPMTMYRSTDGKLDDFHLMYLGARAAGGFGLVFPEQIAITPDGRTTTHCAGLYNDDQIEGHKRVVDMIKSMGGVAGIQLGHTGRKGSLVTPWEGGHMLPPEHDAGWQTRAPSAIAYGGDMPYVPRELTTDEIAQLMQDYADTTRRAVEAGYEWVEMHFAHGYLGSEFFSPLANQRTDQYGGSLQNRTRFHLEALDAVRNTLPDYIPLTMRLGIDDLHPDGATVDESITAIGWMKEHGLDLADVSIGFNTNNMQGEIPIGALGGMVKNATRVRTEVGIPVATSWNLGQPELANKVIQEDLLDLVYLGRPALANAHWPVYAARLLGYQDPFSLVPEDWAWWLRNFRGADEAIGWPAATNGAALQEVAGVAAAAPLIEETTLSEELKELEAELENA
ncbi:NADH:flavin oxidoreductase/NADH oxidase [Pseudarthrobacter sp. NPDC080039]|uniref:NADH:flavin oxidoreductase/NADH oxidase n=1 Tax=unclassified Pseudarthrobacter TaxID=2647000 RepID=UPI00344ECF82